MPQNIFDTALTAPPPPEPGSPAASNIFDSALNTPAISGKADPTPHNVFDKALFGGNEEKPSTPSAPESNRFGEDEPWWSRPITTYAGIPEYREGAGPVERAVEKFGSGLLNPLNIGLAVVTGGLGGIAEAGAAEAGELGASAIGRGMMFRGGESILSKLAPQTAQQVAKASGVIAKMANVGFTGQMIYGVAQAVPRVSDAIKAGDSDTAIEEGTTALLGAAMAGMSLTHLAHSLPGGKSKVPVWAQDKEALAAYQQPARAYGVRAYNFEKANRELVRNRPMDMAALLYHEAGGDSATLEQWRQEVLADKAIKPAIRGKWDGLLQQAQSLPENVRNLSRDLRGTYDDFYQKLVDMGKLPPEKIDPETGERVGVKRTNYAGQHEHFQGDEGSSDLKDIRARSTKTPGFVKRRTFDNVIDALHNGWEQKTGLAESHGAYLRRFGEMEGLMAAENRMIALKADDGRPLAINPAKTRNVQGVIGVPVPSDYDVSGARLGKLPDEPTVGPAVTGEDYEGAMARRPNLSTPEEVKKEYGTTPFISNTGWLLPDGSKIPLVGQHHEMVSGAAEKFGMRERFIDEHGGVRVRRRVGRGGQEFVFSLPEGGVTPEQLSGIKEAAGVIPNGQVFLETTGNDGMPSKVQYVENPTPEKLEAAVGKIGGVRSQDEAMARRRPEAGSYVESKFQPMLAAIHDSHTNNGGSTFNIEQGDMAGKDAYAVALFPERTLTLDHAPTQDDIAGYIKKNSDLLQDPRASFGSWNDPATGKHIFDISATTPDRAEAIALGKKYDQNAIFSLKNFETIPTGGTGGNAFAENVPAAQRLADLSRPLAGQDQAVARRTTPREMTPGEQEDKDFRVSTRVPTAVKGTENPVTSQLTVESKHILENPKIAAKVAEKIKNYPGIKLTPEELADPAKAINAFVNHVSGNISWLYNQLPEEVRNSTKKWYDGARNVTEQWAQDHGVTRPQASGVIAALSPQKDWHMNVSLAERIIKIHNIDTDVTPEMVHLAKGYVRSWPGLKGLFKNIEEGQKYSELTDPKQKAAFIRLYDEAHNSRSYNTLSPEGKSRGLAVTKGGENRMAAWGSFGEIAKAVSILEDGSKENIHRQLGFAHKVRNFFNNILLPNNVEHGDVTVDTHAVAAGLLRPLSGNSPEVTDNFGGLSHAMSGTKGLYGLYADAYRQAAAKAGILPREMQSIAWEAIRELFPAEFKRGEGSTQINDIWKDYSDGKTTIRQARNRVVKASGGFQEPDWLRYSRLRSGVSEGGGSAPEQGELSEGGLLGSSSQRGAGNGVDASGRDQEAGDTSFNPEELARRSQPIPGKRVVHLMDSAKSSLSNPAETGGLRVLDLNESGRDLLSLALGHGYKWDGVNESADRIMKAADTLEKTDKAQTSPQYQELIQNMRAAAEHNGDAGVPMRLTGLPAEVAQAALDEELWHAGQRAAGQGRWTVHTDAVTTRLGENPLEQKVSQNLQRIGYPDHPRTIALEAEAKFLAGDLAGIGLTAEEGQQLMFDHWQALMAEHPEGITSPNEHAQRYAAAMKKVAEAYAERIKQIESTKDQLQRPQAGRQVGEVPRAGTAGDDTRAGEGGDQEAAAGSESSAVFQRARPEGVDRPVTGQEPAPVWYLKSSRAVDERMPNTASAEQVRNILTAAGIKADEVKWTGLGDFLKTKDTFTKQEVQDYLAANNVEVKEVTLGANEERIAAEKELAGVVKENDKLYSTLYAWSDQLDKQQGGETDRISALYNASKAHDPQEVDKAIEAFGETYYKELARRFVETDQRAEQLRRTIEHDPHRADTKFESYTLPGQKENYRELLLTLPPSEVGKPAPLSELPEDYATGVDYSQPDNQKYHVLPPDQVHARPYAGRHGSPEAARAEALEKLNRDRIYEWQGEQEKQQFRSGHFDEPNILAHVRFDDRTDADGNKVLMIEEVQSDWHQKGRKEGYKGEPLQYGQHIEGYTPVGYTWQKDANRPGVRHVVHQLVDPSGKVVSEGYDRPDALRKSGLNPSVPDAPFKTTWHEMALRRMIRYAAENGYDKIGWTTGEQQAERYDLSKHIDTLGYETWKNPQGETRYSIEAGKDNRSLIKKTNLTAADLEGAIGKEMARKIVDGEKTSTTTRKDWEGKPQPLNVISGIDLKVGGEGMKGFYDKILPEYMAKYGKKWGAKVEETRIGASPKEFKDIQVDKEPESLGGLYKIQWTDEKGASRFMTGFDTASAARGWLGTVKGVDEIKKGAAVVHSLPVTQAMKDSVLGEGQPMFRRSAPAPGEAESRPANGQEDGRPKIMSDKGKLYFDVSDYKPGPDVFSRYRVRAIDKNGDPIHERANLLIHPDYVDHVQKAFNDSSWFRKNPITSALLKVSTEGKKSLLSFSPFHWTTEYLRGIQMGLSPLQAMRPGELTPDRLAVTSKFGPTLMDNKSKSLFSEGAAQHSNLINKIPFFGQILGAAENKLFGEYIPRLKADAFDKVVAQLGARHPNWTEDQVHFASSKIVDSAFGGLNWKMMGVSANSQDALRLVMLAPDFTGSQVLFAKYGTGPGGSVVHQSLARIALYNFLVARTLNMLVSGKAHMEHPFGVVSPDEKKTWSVRTMPEDIFHALTDPRGFTYNRLNPVVARTGWEALSGRDQKGKAVTAQQELHDLFRNVMPIPAQNLVPSFKRPDETVAEGVLRGLGAAAAPNTTVAQKNAAVLASNHAESGPVDASRLEHHQKILQLEDALRSGQVPMTSLSEAVLSGQLAIRDAKAIKENVQVTRGMSSDMAKLYTRSARLPMNEFLDQVWTVATPPEKTALLPLLMKKRNTYFKSAMTEMTPQQRLSDPTIKKLMRMFPQETVF